MRARRVGGASKAARSLAGTAAAHAGRAQQGRGTPHARATRSLPLAFAPDAASTWPRGSWLADPDVDGRGERGTTGCARTGVQGKEVSRKAAAEPTGDCRIRRRAAAAAVLVIRSSTRNRDKRYEVLCTYRYGQDGVLVRSSWKLYFAVARLCVWPWWRCWWCW